MWVHSYHAPAKPKLIISALATSTVAKVAYLGRMPQIIDIDTIWQEQNSPNGVRILDLLERAAPKKIYAEWWASIQTEHDSLINSGPPSSSW